MLGVECALLLTVALLIMTLISGYPVGFSLGGAGILGLALTAVFTEIGLFQTGITAPIEQAFNQSVGALAIRLSNGLIGGGTAQIFLAIPLFVLMGTILQYGDVAQRLFNSGEKVLFQLVPALNGRPAILVILLSVLLSATTGVVGASVSSLALVTYPSLVRSGATPELASGLVIAGGTLGQLIPPSIVLVLLSLSINEFYAPLHPGKIIEIKTLFAAAVIPGLALAALYLLYALWAWPRRIQPPNTTAEQPPNTTAEQPPNTTAEQKGDKTASTLKDWLVFLSPIFLIALVLGSILAGLTTLSEGAGLGVLGAITLTFIIGKLNFHVLKASLQKAVSMWANIALILIGALIFNLSIKGFGGDIYLQELLSGISSPWHLLLLVLLAFFLLGFFLEFVEMTVLLVPIFAPVLFKSNLDPIWVCVLLTLVVQTSFLTPPMGLSLFYFQAAVDQNDILPKNQMPPVNTRTIYRGVAPLIAIQLLMTMMLLALFFVLTSL